MRDDRLTMLFSLAGCWLVIPLAIALIVFGVSALDANLGWLRAGSVAALALSLFLSMLILPVVGLLIALRRPWPYYSVARILLALSGRLPWRLMAFLEEAHRLGLLSQVGSAYQFRHARLRDHLSLAPVLGNAGAGASVEASSVRPAIGVEGVGRRTDSTLTNDEC